MTSLHGIPILIDWNMTERVLHPKSPPRARRRARRGYPQHYATRPARNIVRLPDGSMLMHPAIYEQLKRKLAAGGPR